MKYDVIVNGVFILPVTTNDALEDYHDAGLSDKTPST